MYMLPNGKYNLPILSICMNVTELLFPSDTFTKMG